MEQWHVEVVQFLSQKLTDPEVHIPGSVSHELVNKVVLGMVSPLEMPTWLRCTAPYCAERTQLHPNFAASCLLFMS